MALSRRSFVASSVLALSSSRDRARERTREWQSFQGDARNSGVADDRGPSHPVTVDWTFDAGEGLASSPAVHDGTVCVSGTGGGVYGVDADTGELIWSHSEGTRPNKAPAVFDDAVVVPLTTHPPRLVAFDPADGTVRWEVRFEEGAANPPTVDGDRLFASRTNGGLASYAPGGDRQWEMDVGPRTKTSPAVADGTVVVGSFGGVHAVDARTGEPRWTYSMETFPAYWPCSSPTIAGDTVVYCGGYRDRTRIVGLDLHDGTETFAYPTEKLLYASPAVTGDRLVVGTSTHLLALDWRAGTELWRRPYDDLRDDGGRRPIGDARWSSPVVSDGTVYVGTGGERADQPRGLYGLSLDDGRTEWRTDVAERVTTAPAVTDGRLYVGDRGGTLYAVTDESSAELEKFGLAGGALALFGGGAYAAWWLRDRRSG